MEKAPSFKLKCGTIAFSVYVSMHAMISMLGLFCSCKLLQDVDGVVLGVGENEVALSVLLDGGDALQVGERVHVFTRLDVQNLTHVRKNFYLLLILLPVFPKEACITCFITNSRVP